MEDDKAKELIESQDELVIVCQAAFDVIFANGLQPELDKAMIKNRVTPGFVDRAEQIRERVSKDYQRMLAMSGLTIGSHATN